MQTNLIRFKSKDNLELQGMLFEPEENTSKVIVHVHGWVGNFYENKHIDFLAESAIKNKIALFSFNNRGAGIVTEFLRDSKREKIGGALEKFEESIFDIEGTIDFLETKGYTEIILMGHSLGCQKIVFYQDTKKDKRVKSLVLLAPVNDVEFVQEKLLDKEKYEESLKIAKEMIEDGKGQEAVPDWMQFYPSLTANMFLQVSDPNSDSGRIFDYSGKLTELKNIGVPILAIFGNEDNYQIKPAEKLDILKKEIGCETILINKTNHWFSACEEELAKGVMDWIV